MIYLYVIVFTIIYFKKSKLNDDNEASDNDRN